ncbi:MAG: Maf family protein [Pontiella sp.]
MENYPNIRNLILASASPRRRELLSLLGIDFNIIIPDIDEMHQSNEAPRAFAERLAAEKSAAVSAESDSVLIAADTIVVHRDTILGKPVDEEDAYAMLSSLSGDTHEVVTGVCVRRGEKNAVFSVSTEVMFRKLEKSEIEIYIASGDPMDKAGAYAIQGGAAHFVRSINGSYTNVVGLPLCELHQTFLSF